MNTRPLLIVVGLWLVVAQAARAAATRPVSGPLSGEPSPDVLDDNLPAGCTIGSTMAAESPSGVIAVCWTRTVDQDEYEMTEEGRRARANATLDTTPDIWRHKTSGHLFDRIPTVEELVPIEERFCLALVKDGRLLKKRKIPAQAGWTDLAGLCWTGDGPTMAFRSTLGAPTIMHYVLEDDCWKPGPEASAVSCGSGVWLLQGRDAAEISIIEERFHKEPGPMAWIARSRQQLLCYTDPFQKGQVISDTPVSDEVGVPNYEPVRLPNRSLALIGTRRLGRLVRSLESFQPEELFLQLPGGQPRRIAVVSLECATQVCTTEQNSFLLFMTKLEKQGTFWKQAEKLQWKQPVFALAVARLSPEPSSDGRANPLAPQLIALGPGWRVDGLAAGVIQKRIHVVWPDNAGDLWHVQETESGGWSQPASVGVRSGGRNWLLGTTADRPTLISQRGGKLYVSQLCFPAPAQGRKTGDTSECR